jgi:surface antigen
MILFRIVANLIRLAINLAMLPIIILSRHFLGILLLIAIAYAVVQSSKGGSSNEPTPNVPPPVMNSSTEPQKIEKGKNAEPPVVIDPVRTIEDGNSSFSTDLLQQMTEPERISYSQNFYWAMDHIATGQTHIWANQNIAGKFNVTETFKNKRGQTCKRIKETLKVHSIQQTLDALACQRAQGGWCKLRPNATPGCGLGRASSTLNDISRSFNNLF